ncbi:copper resistance CopC/CopD family protein [Devosia sp.]|uniref:copper resistance CopC/CopD family protein n=1 Tax=Devosia sp. TaxID=1871048 RepID=UPI003BAC85A7
MRLVLKAAVCLLVWLVLNGAALAHASLISASPAQNTVLANAPTQFVLTFNEPVSPLALTLVAPDGSKTTLAEFKLVDSAIEVAVPAGIGNGTFALSYRVISTDGHPVAGSVIFSVGAPSRGAAGADQAVDWVLRTAIWAVRVLVYLGLFFGVGSVAFRRWMQPEGIDAQRPGRVALAGGLVAAPLAVGLQGLDALGLPLAAIVDPSVWAIGFSTSLGPAMTIGFVAMALAALAEWRGGGIGRVLALVALIGVGVALAVTGHAGAAEPQWLTRPAVFVHAVGIATWAGALLPLFAALHGPVPDVAALRRFSRWIPVALLPLIVAGAVLAVIQVGRPSALIETAYGQVLLAKLVLLAGVFALAVYNRLRLTGPVLAGDAVATRRLVRTIAVEAVLIVLVLSVAALWRFTPPPRALALVEAAPLSLHIHTDAAMGEVTFASGATGETSADIVLMTGDFGPLEAKALTLVASNPAAGIEEVKYPAVKQDDGSWRVAPLQIPVPGTWTIRLDIRVSDFVMTRIADDVVFSN